MTNEPFNLEQFKAGRKAITRDGRTWKPCSKIEEAR